MGEHRPGTGDTRHPFFLGLLGLTTVSFAALLLGFWQPVFWAIVLGIIFVPVKKRIGRNLPGRPSLVAGLTVVFIFFTVLVPALFVASAVANEATQLLARIQAGEFDPGVVLEWLQQYVPRITRWAERLGINLNEWQDKLSGVALNGSRFIASLALTAGQNVARFFVMFFLMLYVLFFVVRDGELVLEHVEKAMPLSDSLERQLARKFAEVSRATLKGTLIVGIVQGALGGIMFAILGIQGPVFWGCVMVLLSVVPAVGPGLVWFPAALVLIATGGLTEGLVLIAYGVLVIGLVDNLLRPLLVGRDTKMPDYLVLLSTLGGLTMFGITGFVLGPVVAALFLTLWQMFELESRPEPGALELPTETVDREP
jgi:predicted PurR-regulated permease PerM